MIATCTYCFTKVETTDSNLEHPSYMEVGKYEIRCPACTRLFKFTVPDETALKTLTSSTPWVNEWAKYRAVDANGDLFEYENKPYIGDATDGWEIKEGLSYREGRDYDGSNWKNTLQTRYFDGAKGATVWYDEAEEIPEEVFDKLASTTSPSKKDVKYTEIAPGEFMLSVEKPLASTKPTIAKQLEDRPWPEWAKNLFMERCTEYGYKLTETMHLNKCFEWRYTPEGIGFWDRLITRDTIKEEDIQKIKENKVEEQKSAPVTTTLKDILETIPSRPANELEAILTKCVRQLVFRSTDKEELIKLGNKYDALQKNFDTLLSEKSQLRAEFRTCKKHLQKIMEAVAYGNDQT